MLLMFPLFCFWTGSLFPSEPKKESMAEVSLICEEDLLDTIFQACDTQCRGKQTTHHTNFAFKAG